MFRIRDYVLFFFRFFNESSGYGLWISGNKMFVDFLFDMFGYLLI